MTTPIVCWPNLINSFDSKTTGSEFKPFQFSDAYSESFNRVEQGDPERCTSEYGYLRCVSQSVQIFLF